jgi:hypothetical protein
MRVKLSIAFLLLLVSSSFAAAQTTEFTYQGKLSDGGSPANGSYDLELRLFDVPAGGAALGTQQKPAVVATAGIFTVQLDFGLSVFGGPLRYLEISVRPASSPEPYTILSPRQPVSSTPYAVRSLNASVADTLSSACVGCVTSSQIGSVDGATITGAIPANSLPGDSGSYVQNTINQQASSNFNISGTGTANILNAATQYNLAGVRVLSIAPGGNLLAGVNSGTVNAGTENSFFGAAAGATNATGSNNSFFGTQSGASNTNGLRNSLFGSRAGFENINGSDNSYFGFDAGSQVVGSRNSSFGVSAGRGGFTTQGALTNFSDLASFGYNAGRLNLGYQNSFFGSGAGERNALANSNSFFGFQAGAGNETGDYNSYFGSEAGWTATGSDNSFFGVAAGSYAKGSRNSYFGFFAGAGSLHESAVASNNAFFGFNAGANNLGDGNAFLGSDAGFQNSTGTNNSFIGGQAGYGNTTGTNNSFFGSEAGRENASGNSNAFLGRFTGNGNTSGSRNTFVGTNAGITNTSGNNNTALGYAAAVASGNLSFATAIGSGAVVDASNTLVLGRTGDNVITPGNLFIKSIGGGGNTSVCRNAAGKIANCSSSFRYKTAVQSFTGGLSIVRRLRPITFNWKDGGMLDVGFGAEEVARVEPLLTTRNEQGQIEGVKYAQITTVLVNAVNEQQTQIDQQQRKNKELELQLKQAQQQIEGLQKLICLSHRQAVVCKQR